MTGLVNQIADDYCSCCGGIVAMVERRGGSPVRPTKRAVRAGEQRMAHLVKICGLNTVVAVDAAIEAGADMIGLVFFAKSPRHVGLDYARRLADHARGRAEIVALTVDASDATLAAIVEAVAPDWLQLHGGETPARTGAIRQAFGRPVMKAIGLSGAGDVDRARTYAAVADRLLLDAKPLPGAMLPGGNGLAFDWRLVAGLDLAVPFMLSGGLTPLNVAEAVSLAGSAISFVGVDVSSGVESAPGVKDGARIGAFVAAARSAWAQRAARDAATPANAGREDQVA